MNNLGAYIVKRLATTIPMLFVLITVVFILLRVIPGDPVQAMLGGRNVSKELIERKRAELGFDKPIHEQYVEYLAGIFKGDFGNSLRTDKPVLQEIFSRFPATLELAFWGMFIALLLGVGTGVWAAVKSDTLIDHGLRIFHIGAFAVPIFWMGLMFQIVFAVYLGWLPVGNRLGALSMAMFTPITKLYVIDTIIKGRFDLLIETLRHLLLPALTLGIIQAGLLGRMSRANMLEIIDLDYVKTARAKGLAERIVVFKHALRNAMIPIITVLGLQFAILMGGAVLTETVYSWPGVARFLIRSVDARDYPAIQGSIIFIAIFISVINLIVDVLYAQLDPRVRY
ncbi:ABC transporter permease [Candidatus Bipolaricaulota bacterium]|nr:ABC transporter permease [Candidatus Bipolaricaulota bacterium]